MANQPEQRPGRFGQENADNPEADQGEIKMDQLKENVQHIAENVRHEANRIASDFSDRAKDVYDDANDWLKENYGKTLLTVGVLAGVGLIGYLLARNQGSSQRYRGYK